MRGERGRGFLVGCLVGLMFVFWGGVEGVAEVFQMGFGGGRWIFFLCLRQGGGRALWDFFFFFFFARGFVGVAWPLLPSPILFYSPTLPRSASLAEVDRVAAVALRIIMWPEWSFCCVMGLWIMWWGMLEYEVIWGAYLIFRLLAIIRRLSIYCRRWKVENSTSGPKPSQPYEAKVTNQLPYFQQIDWLIDGGGGGEVLSSSCLRKGLWSIRTCRWVPWSSSYHCIPPSTQNAFPLCPLLPPPPFFFSPSCSSPSSYPFALSSLILTTLCKNQLIRHWYEWGGLGIAFECG